LVRQVFTPRGAKYGHAIRCTCKDAEAVKIHPVDAKYLLENHWQECEKTEFSAWSVAFSTNASILRDHWQSPRDPARSILGGVGTHGEVVGNNVTSGFHNAVML
jgi:hypothetical protein